MAIPTAEKLIERARLGERLTSTDRRLCVGYLMATQAQLSNVEMAELFAVSEGLIRRDKLNIREHKAKLIKEDDIALVIADIHLQLERQLRDLESSKRKCREGSKDYVTHCRLLVELQLKVVDAMQNLGYYPRNLGNMTVQKFEYKAIVGKDGSVDTRPTDMAFDAEFEDVKQLPAPETP